MGLLGRLDLVTAAFADAAVDASRWDAAMEKVSEATGSVGAILFPVDGKLPRLPHSRSLEASVDEYVRGGWIRRDERNRILPALERRGVGTDFDFMTADSMKRHPYYQEFLAPHGLHWFAGVKVACGDDMWCLSIQRSASQGPFSPAALRKLEALSSHLAASAAVARALDFARADAALAAFAASGSAVVLLDRHGGAIRCNPPAQRLFGPDLQLSRNRIVSWRPEATAALDRALKALLFSQTATALLPPVRLPRRNGRPFLAYPLRLPEVAVNGLSPCQAIIVIVDLEARPCPPDEALRTSFGLTAAEARLARHVASGDSIETVAERLGIAYETARNQLKSVFAKTDTHRQSELAILLAQFLNRPITPP
jgi:DNA-binding CsgD family transcriptional regulator/PAS domain-containing protein